LSGKTYSIQDLACCVGVSTATLRAWERRYGIMSPERTRGGHRVYSESDLKLFLFINHLRDSGMSLIDIGKMDQSALENDARAYFESLALPTSDSDYESNISLQIIAALKSRNFEGAIEILERAAVTATQPTEFANLAIGIMESVGEAWSRKEITISIEHLFTARIRFLLAEQFYRSRNALHGSARKSLGTTNASAETAALGIKKDRIAKGNPFLAHAMIAGLEGEAHEIGLLRVAIFLQHWGLRVTYLGPDLPLEDLSSFLDECSRQRMPSDPPIIVCAGISGVHSKKVTVSLAQRLNDSIASRYPTALGGGGITKLSDVKSELKNLLISQDLEALWNLFENKSENKSENRSDNPNIRR
jgi:DNA-binding transcriptional MerR regulator